MASTFQNNDGAKHVRSSSFGLSLKILRVAIALFYRSPLTQLEVQLLTQ